MKKILTAIILLNFISIFCNAQDTVKLFIKNNEPMELSAPQRYYTYYNWIMPNNTTISNKDIIVSFPNTGTYLLTCEATDDCIDSKNTIYYQIVSKAYNVAENPIEQVVIYPNPINNIGPFILIDSKIENLNCNVVVMGSTGELIDDKNVTLLFGSNTFNYSDLFRNQINGLYFINIVTDNFSKTYKIIKQ